MAKQEHFYGPFMASHVHAALESFPMKMTRKELIANCAEYISKNAAIEITPAWFAQWMMDDCFLLVKDGKVKGSKARIWKNVHLQYKNDTSNRLRVT
jgi:hypothetical protein